MWLNALKDLNKVLFELNFSEISTGARRTSSFLLKIYLGTEEDTRTEVGFLGIIFSEKYSMLTSSKHMRGSLDNSEALQIINRRYW